ncbi:MAG: biopolymer transporter ExbD [Opitutaceae bacterium]
MAGSSGGSKGGKKTARIEIIPLIDVIFFLLATFVLFTLSLNKSNGISGIVVPTSETGGPRDTIGSATISITPEGTIAWDKDPISADVFLARLKTFHVQNPDGRYLINGDENASFNVAFGYVIDEIRKSGATKVFIETHVKPAGK